MSHFYPNRARVSLRWGSLNADMFGVQYVLSRLLNAGMFPIKQYPSSAPLSLPPHPLTPLPNPLIFPQEPQMLGCKSNVSSRSVVCTVRNKNARTKE